MKCTAFFFIAVVAALAATRALCEEIPQFDKEAFIASAAAEKTLELGMVDCVAMALENNSEIKVKKISTRIEDANVMIQKARFEPDLSFDFTMEDNTELSDMPLFTPSPSKTRTGTFNFGYNEKLVTGTTLGVNFYNLRTRSNSRIQSVNPVFNSEAEVTITQPLLKGFGILVNKADFIIAKNNRQRSHKDFAQEVIGVLTDTKKAYYDLLYRQKQYEIAEVSLARVESLYRVIEAKYDKGAASDVDVLQMEAERARKEGELIASEEALKLSEDSLKLITNLVDNQEFWNARITLLNEPTYEKAEIGLVDAIIKAFDHRPDYASARIDLRNKDIAVAVNRNGMLPTVDLIGSFGLNGLDKVYEKDLAVIGGGRYQDWALGVQVSVPLGSDEEKGKYEKSKFEKKQALINFQRLEQNIILDVRDAVRGVDINYRMLEANAKAKDAQEKQYKAQEERFAAGLVSTHDILDYAERLSKAEADYMKSIIDYNIALIGLAKSEGMTLVNDHITIE